MRVHTETGSVYEFNNLGQVRRVEYTHDLRGDGRWLNVALAFDPMLGYPMVLQLEPLSPNAGVTIRRTSNVIKIEED